MIRTPRVWMDNPHTVSVNRYCKVYFPKLWELYTILLVAASGGADWCYAVVTPRRVF